MVRFIRDFILKGRDNEIFIAIREKLPVCMSKLGEYDVDTEINENGRFYRKSFIKKNIAQKMIPGFIQEKLSSELIQTMSDLVEENIFYEKELKIQWNIIPRTDAVYSLFGSTRFMSIDHDRCKVIIMIHLEWNNIEKYIYPHLLPLIESKMPDIYLHEINTIYKQILSSP